MNFVGDEFAVIGERGELLVRQEAVWLAFDVPGVVATEGDEVRVRVRVNVKVPDADADRRVMRQTHMNGRRILRGADVAAVWRDTIIEAVKVDALSAAVWLGREGDLAPLRQRIHKAINTAAYLSGLEVVGDFRLEAECPAYDLRTAEERRRKDRDAAEARRIDSARKAADAMREAREKGVSAGDVLSRVGADEGQAILLSTLGSERTADLQVFCAAGNAIVTLTPQNGRWETAVTTIADTLGPVRSVYTDGQTLLVGARDGIWRVDGQHHLAYRDATMSAEHGFSAITRSGDLLWGAHRQRGLVWWDLGRPDAPAGFIRNTASGAATSTPTIPPPLPPPLPGATSGGSPDVSILRTERVALGAPALPGAFTAIMPWRDGGVLAAGAEFEEVGTDGSRRKLGYLPSRCVLLCEAEDSIAAVCEDGVIRLFDVLDLRPSGEIKVGEPVTSAALMPWSGGARILCAAAGAGIISIGVGDPVVIRYACVYRGVREVAGGNGLVVGVSPDRMRVVAWDAWEPRRPSAEVHVGAVVRGRVGDVAVK